MLKKNQIILAVSFCLILLGCVLVYSAKINNSLETDGNAIEQPVPTPMPTIKPAEKISFVAAGDNLIHGMLYIQAANRAQQMGYDFEYAYDNIAYYFDDFDVKFINQETLVNDAFPPSTYPLFSSPIELGQQMIKMGFNAIGMSNNHSYDKGAAGISSSLEFWEKQKDLVYFGFYTDNDEEDIKYLEINGIKVAFLAYTSYTNGLSISDPNSPKIIFTHEYDTIQRQIKVAKENADFVVVSCHWGYEDTNQTIPLQHEIAQQLNAFGADAIIGTHPHVIQTVEWIENPENGHKTFVCYSLGNFISAQSAPNNMLGGLLQFDIVKTYTDLEDNYTITLENPLFVPTVTHYDANYQNVRNYLLKDYTTELAQRHGVRQLDGRFSLEFMENIIYKYIPEEFLLYK